MSKKRNDSSLYYYSLSLEQFSMIFETLRKAFIITDENLKIKHLGGGFESIFNIKKDDFLKNGFKIIFPDIFSYKQFIKFLENSSRSIFNTSSVFRNIRSDKTELHIKYTTISLNLNGEKEVLIIMEDISEIEEQRKLIMQKEKDLKHYQKLDVLGKLISGVAHDLNNPLASIYGLSNMLLEDKNITDEIKQDMRVIVKATEQCKNIVENLLKFVRKKKEEKEYVDLNDLIESVILFLNYHLRKNQIEDISINMHGKDFTVFGYFSELQQVLYNILINAIEETVKIPQEKRKIEIKCYSNDKIVICEIFNTGNKIAPEIRDKIFEPFFSTKNDKGTGLGLYISKKIIEEHGGTITIDENVEDGARFIISLPHSKATILKPITDSNKKLSLKIKNKKILIIDDNEDFIKFLQKLLKENNIDVAKNISEAEKKKLNSYDIIICDVLLPDGSGINFYQKHKGKSKFIFVTGDVLDLNLFSFFETNNLMCIKKPFTGEEFIKAILSE